MELNAQRKSMTADGVELAKQIVDEGTAGEKVLVIYLPGVHESLAGIIAGRIRESYHKPVFVLTDGEEGVKGVPADPRKRTRCMTRCASAGNVFQNLADIRWRQGCRCARMWRYSAAK